MSNSTLCVFIVTFYNLHNPDNEGNVRQLCKISLEQYPPSYQHMGISMNLQANLAVIHCILPVITAVCPGVKVWVE